MKPFKLINKSKRKFIVFNKNISIGLIGSKKNNTLKKIINSQNYDCKIFDHKKDKNIKSFFKKVDILISYDNHYIFSHQTIKNFKYQILNIHGSILPKFAGRGTYSNMILLNHNLIGSTLHIVTPRIDMGEILMFSKKVKIDKKSFPINYLKMVEKLSSSLMKKFLIKIKNSSKIELFPQNENLRFFSRKYISSINGEIDWNWKGVEIEKFVRAFSNPYKGAYSFLDKNIEKQIFIKKIKFTKKITHPFLIGKIFNYDSKKKIIKICVKDGFVSINLNDITINKNKNFLNSLEGKYFKNSLF